MTHAVSVDALRMGVDDVIVSDHLGLMADDAESRVRERADRVEALIGRFTLALAILHKEREELDVAIRVLERFDSRPQFEVEQAAANELVHGVNQTGPPPKPVQLPTVPEMIVEALTDAAWRGEIGLEPKAILAFIRDRYWPQAQQTSVGPIVWRMAKEGRLQKRGTLYSLPENETPAVAAVGASEPEGEADDADHTLL